MKRKIDCKKIEGKKDRWKERQMERNIDGKKDIYMDRKIIGVYDYDNRYMAKTLDTNNLVIYINFMFKFFSDNLHYVYLINFIIFSDGSIYGGNCVLSRDATRQKETRGNEQTRQDCTI